MKSKITTRSLIIAAVSILVLVGCFYVLAVSIHRLPPETIKPNAKPALNLPSNQNTMKVEAKTAEQADISVTKSSPSQATSVTKCDQPQSSQPQSASALPSSSPVASLTATLDLPKNKSGQDLGSKLQSTLLNITGGLSQ